MSTDLLFEHFATLATAPDGIARLRELILQLAVQGKLGTQNAGDEPASILLKEILKERHLSPNKKNPNVISSEEIPFEIPRNWIFAKIGDISQIIRGISYTKGDEVPFAKENYAPLLRSNNINNGVNFEKLVYVPKDFIEAQKWIKIGDLIIAMSSGSANLVGKTAQIESEFKGSVGAFCGIIRPTHLILKEYLKYFFQCPYYRSTVSGFGQGIGINNLGINNLQNILLPLAPLAEQHRIVAKVDRLMALCDELEARQQQERAGCLRLGTASLAGLQNATHPEEFGRQWAQVCDAFDVILDCPENVAVLRQTILQLAVQGRLGTQNPKDEPADKLFSRIKREREQVIKAKPIVIRPLENPKLHTLPDHWIWVRLGDVLADIRYGTSEKSDPQFRGIPVIRIPNIGNGILNFNGMKYLQIKDEIDTHKIKNGDLLTIRSNGSRDLVGKCAVAKNIDRSIAFASYLIRLRPILVNSEFLALVLSSQNVRDQFFLSAKTTTGVHNINTEELARTMLALPPLAEQHRIVAKVDALMVLCDALESRLKERAGVQGRLAGAVVKGIV
jgi:type I restriction enzyme S subunit